MIQGSAYYRGNEVEVDFTATGEVSDYGVDRSPEFIEWGDFEVTLLTICGVTVKLEALPADLAEAIHDLHREVEFEADD